jgi:hypothetical protein
MKQFYKTHAELPKLATLLRELSWSKHFPLTVELATQPFTMKVKDQKGREDHVSVFATDGNLRFPKRTLRVVLSFKMIRLLSLHLEAALRMCGYC